MADKKKTLEDGYYTDESLSELSPSMRTYREGVKAYYSGDDKATLRNSRKALDMNPDNMEARMLAQRTLLKTGGTKAVRREFGDRRK